MRKLLFLIPLLFFTISLFSQDLIVKKNNDTIHCKIQNRKVNGFKYNKSHSEELLYLPNDSIRSYKRTFKKTSYNLYGGLGISNPLSSDMRNVPIHYSNPWIKGIYLEASYSFFITETLGFGLKYSSFLSSFKQNYLIPVNISGNIITLPNYYKDSAIAFAQYIGPTICIRSPFYNRGLSVVLSIGYSRYLERATLESQDLPLILIANTMDYSYSIQHDFDISTKYSMGIMLGLSGDLIRTFSHRVVNNNSNIAFSGSHTIINFSTTFRFKK